MGRIAIFSVSSLAIGLGIGWYAGPWPAHHYCDECAKIIALQSKSEVLADDRREARRLNDELVRKQRARITWAHSSGEPIDLHPDCECLCHRYWVAGAANVHD